MSKFEARAFWVKKALREEFVNRGIGFSGFEVDLDDDESGRVEVLNGPELVGGIYVGDSRGVPVGDGRGVADAYTLKFYPATQLEPSEYVDEIIISEVSIKEAAAALAAALGKKGAENVCEDN